MDYFSRRAGEDFQEAVGRALVDNSPKIRERIKAIASTEGVPPGGVLIRVEFVNCGKKCKSCPHGPYLYAYWKQDGKTRSKYIGKAGTGKKKKKEDERGGSCD